MGPLIFQDHYFPALVLGQCGKIMILKNQGPLKSRAEHWAPVPLMRKGFGTFRKQFYERK